ncbi:MAG: hypothetical protein HY035_09175 [Nitrospirae bacterium]|nr:hypothetical protein [Nitrospirota bacterium]MBI3378551.1 hypothetical protein [Nitrospirota bacterium]
MSRREGKENMLVIEKSCYRKKESFQLSISVTGDDRKDVLSPGYCKGLQGIEQFSHALIITFG